MMVRRSNILKEIVILAAILLIGFRLAQVPEVRLKDLKGEAPEMKNLTSFKRNSVKIDRLLSRNIFRADGLYDEKAPASKEESYALVAILIGKEKRAIFRDSKGALISLSEGSILPDGFRVESIKTKGVILKRSKEIKELTILTTTKGRSSEAR